MGLTLKMTLWGSLYMVYLWAYLSLYYQNMFEEGYECWLLKERKTMCTTTDPENRLYWVANLGSYASFSVLVLLEVRENA